MSLTSLPIVCIVTPCVNNESPFIHYTLFAL
ncbi:hypothetical protein KSS87_010093 [Heliosperma pusillum]|nr:hypothetical protein KSS87_010093 [Heliosperma pusillum]